MSLNKPEYASNDRVYMSDLKADVQPMDHPRTFGLSSAATQQLWRDQITQQLQDVSTVNRYLHGSLSAVNETGKPLINFDSGKEWFISNVTFMFASGMIFGENDNKRMNRVLKSFENEPNKAYLMNPHQVMSYDDEVIKAIESERGYDNGNYHIMMAVIVNPDDLDNAPLPELSHEGVVYSSLSWDQIETVLAKYISMFGVVAEYVEEYDDGGLKRRRRGNYLLGNHDDSTSILRMSISDFPNETDAMYEYNKRQNLRGQRLPFGEDQRAPGLGVDQRFKAGKSLYDRINADMRVNLTPAVDGNVGAMLRSDDMYLPPENQNPEYVLYRDNPSTYDHTNGTNITANANPIDKMTLPNFSATGIIKHDSAVDTGFGIKSKTNAKGEHYKHVSGFRPLFPSSRK